MRVLLTGASGYLGRHILALLPSHWRVWACYRQQPVALSPHITPLSLDISDEAAVRDAVRSLRPDLVLHTAIARQPESFASVIVQGSAHIAATAAAACARLLHLSTDILFDGLADAYDESALPCPEPASGQPDPLNPHGRAKARAENLVRSLHPAPIIARTSLIYGFDPLDHSTIWLADGLRRGQTVTLFTDQIRCPIYAPDLAASLIELAETDFTGVMNLAGPTPLSRYDFGRLLCQRLYLDPSHLRGIPTPSDFVAPRRLVLTDELARTFLRTPRRTPQQVCVVVS